MYSPESHVPIFFNNCSSAVETSHPQSLSVMLEVLGDLLKGFEDTEKANALIEGSSDSSMDASVGVRLRAMLPPRSQKIRFEVANACDNRCMLFVSFDISSFDSLQFLLVMFLNARVVRVNFCSSV